MGRKAGAIASWIEGHVTTLTALRRANRILQVPQVKVTALKVRGVGSRLQVVRGSNTELEPLA